MAIALPEEMLAGAVAAIYATLTGAAAAVYKDGRAERTSWTSERKEMLSLISDLTEAVNGLTSELKG